MTFQSLLAAFWFLQILPQSPQTEVVEQKSLLDTFLGNTLSSQVMFFILVFLSGLLLVASFWLIDQTLAHHVESIFSIQLLHMPDPIHRNIRQTNYTGFYF